MSTNRTVRYDTLHDSEGKALPCSVWDHGAGMTLTEETVVARLNQLTTMLHEAHEELERWIRADAERSGE